MFLTKDDLETAIRLYRIDQITDQDEDLLSVILQTAEQNVIDYLHQHYDTESIFAQTGTDRKLNALNWCKYIALYLMYERIPDEQVPERVIKNYDDTIELLKKIAEGRYAVDLPRRTVEDTNGNPKPNTKFRWGSLPSRSY